MGCCSGLLVFFFNGTATTEIYTLSLHDALPISERGPGVLNRFGAHDEGGFVSGGETGDRPRISGKLRPKFMSVPGWGRILGQRSPKRSSSGTRARHSASGAEDREKERF